MSANISDMVTGNIIDVKLGNEFDIGGANWHHMEVLGVQKRMCGTVAVGLSKEDNATVGVITINEHNKFVCTSSLIVGVHADSIQHAAKLHGFTL